MLWSLHKKAADVREHAAANAEGEAPFPKKYSHMLPQLGGDVKWKYG